MSKIDEIEVAIDALPEKEYIRLRKWFSERDWKRWDKQIKANSKAGKLDFLIKEAFHAKAKGKLKAL